MKRAGPYPHLRLNTAVQLDQAQRVFNLIAAGAGFREAGQRTGLSTTTAWRRYWWLQDWTLPAFYGRPRGPFPPQRHTRVSPSGDRPCLPTLDHPELSVVPAVRCGARARSRGGAPCRNWAMKAQRRCRMHGGASPQARRDARAQLVVAKVMRQRTWQVHRARCEHGQRTEIQWRP